MNHEETILSALNYNADEIADIPEVDTFIRRGEPMILTSTDAPGTGWKEILWAVPVVRLSSGKYAYAADPAVLEYRLKRGQTAAAMVAWWARKNFGKELPQHSIKR